VRVSSKWLVLSFNSQDSYPSGARAITKNSLTVWHRNSIAPNRKWDSRRTWSTVGQGVHCPRFAQFDAQHRNGLQTHIGCHLGSVNFWLWGLDLSQRPLGYQGTISPNAEQHQRINLNKTSITRLVPPPPVGLLTRLEPNYGKRGLIGVAGIRIGDLRLRLCKLRLGQFYDSAQADSVPCL
jgi:hypothetical protein